MLTNITVPTQVVVTGKLPCVTNSSIGIIGNIYIIIAGSCCSNNNLDKFVSAGKLYNINRFYSIGIFGYNSSKKK